MMSIVTPRYDIARFGAENMRASPRQADMLILSGRVSIKMAPVVRRIYDQMLEPKWVIAMGACSSSGGMFANYAVVQGADKFMPVDVHVPGCPPRPEALLSGFNKLQRMIQGNPDPGWRRRYNAIGTEEWARDGAPSPREEERDAYAAARDLARGGNGRARRGRPVPDAPGLELIAQDLNGTLRGLGPRHLLRARPGRARRRPRAHPRRAAAGCATHPARSTASCPASTPPTTSLPSRGSASTTSC